MGICVGRCFVEGGPSTESLRTWRSKTYHGSDAGTTSGNRKSRMWDASSRSRDRSKVIPQTELSNFMDKVDMPGDELESFYTTLQVFKPTPRYTRRVSLNPSIGKILENSEMSSKYVEEDEEEENDTESEVSLPICPPVFPSEESRNTGSMDWGHSASPGPSRTSRRRSSGFNYDDEFEIASDMFITASQCRLLLQQTSETSVTGTGSRADIKNSESTKHIY